jgi:hypothetical protein
MLILLASKPQPDGKLTSVTKSSALRQVIVSVAWEDGYAIPRLAKQRTIADRDVFGARHFRPDAGLARRSKGSGGLRVSIQLQYLSIL